jgi:hypothetical protein
MAVKKPSKTAVAPQITAQQVDDLASQLVDKPYGEKSTKTKPKNTDSTARTSISLPKNLLEEIEDLAIKNKRENKDPKNVSAIIREALERYLI